MPGWQYCGGPAIHREYSERCACNLEWGRFNPGMVETPGNDAVASKPKRKRRWLFPDGDYAAFQSDPKTGNLVPIPGCPMAPTDGPIKKWLQDNASAIVEGMDAAPTIVVVKFTRKFKLQVERTPTVKFDEAPRHPASDDDES